MRKPKKARFLKRVMVYSLAMSTIVTMVVLAIGWAVKDIPSSTVVALCGLWSIELTLSAWIKNAEEKPLEAKQKNNKTYTEESI